MKDEGKIIIGFITVLLCTACYNKVKHTQAGTHTQTMEEHAITSEDRAKESPIIQNTTDSLQPSRKEWGEKYPLLPHLSEQEKILREKSIPADSLFTPDGKYSIGKFGEGVIELTLRDIDGEPAYLYGIQKGSDDTGTELEFLLYGLGKELDSYTVGKTYSIYWAETICLMEPFNHGYQRCYIAYKIK